MAQEDHINKDPKPPQKPLENKPKQETEPQWKQTTRNPNDPQEKWR